MVVVAAPHGEMKQTKHLQSLEKSGRRICRIYEKSFQQLSYCLLSQPLFCICPQGLQRNPVLISAVSDNEPMPGHYEFEIF